MKNTFRKMLSVMTVSMLLAQGTALADTISFEGTVAPVNTQEIYAPIGGNVRRVTVEIGQAVKAGDVLATLDTTKVYAKESGTITGLFGQPGDNAETVAQKYGAVMYIEGESVYSITASTDQAYDKTANQFVHVGEPVYLSCYSDSSHTGVGVITSIQGADFVVKVLSGEFLIGETVSVYRGETAKTVNRIGRGKLTRTNPTAVTGTGSIVSFAVSNGDTVQRGDLLFEMLNGDFDGLYMSGNQITAGSDGVIAELNLSQGGKIDKDSVAAVLYPANGMRIEAQVEEISLAEISVGDPVIIEFLWNQDAEVTYEGTISMISYIATTTASSMEESGIATYTVYIDFTPDENTRYGMSAIISTVEEDNTDDEVVLSDQE